MYIYIYKHIISQPKSPVYIYICIQICIYIYMYMISQPKSPVYIHICIQICIYIYMYMISQPKSHMPQEQQVEQEEDNLSRKKTVVSCFATISRLLKIVGLFCRISSSLKGSFAKETYVFFEEPLIKRTTRPMCK